MVSIKEVALAAGVSTATVSRVLSNKPYVRPELHERVMSAVEQLGYRPNLVARSLRSQQSNTIGLIVSDIRNPFFTSVSRAVEDYANEHGLTLLLCNTDEDPNKEALYLHSMKDQNVSGLIFSPTRQSARNYDSIKSDIPTVVIDRTVRDADVDVVLLDNVDSAHRLTNHLIENGCRNLAGIFGEASVTGRERQQGFEKAMREHGLMSIHLKFVPHHIEDGYNATMEMLQTSSRPDGLIASNSLLLAGALKACRDSHMRIPADIALAGFDDAIWTTLVEPALTVIAQPTDEIGRTAVELLLKRIESPDGPFREVILKGRLIERESSLKKIRVPA